MRIFDVVGVTSWGCGRQKLIDIPPHATHFTLQMHVAKCEAIPQGLHQECLTILLHVR